MIHSRGRPNTHSSWPAHVLIMGTGTTYLPQYQHHCLNGSSSLQVTNWDIFPASINYCQLKSTSLIQQTSTESQWRCIHLHIPRSSHSDIHILRCRKHPEHHHNQHWHAEHHVNSLIRHVTTIVRVCLTNGLHWPLTFSIITEACSTNQEWANTSTSQTCHQCRASNQPICPQPVTHCCSLPNCRKLSIRDESSLISWHGRSALRSTSLSWEKSSLNDLLTCQQHS